jgi:hypothetical protein
MSSTGDRNLLVGILALQMDFITLDQLVASLSTWVLDKARPLDEILFRQTAIDEDTHSQLKTLVNKQIGLRADDPTRSIGVMSSIAFDCNELMKIGDSQIDAT